ncbi:MAG: hypothetical protein ABIG30_00660 [Candidatus Aenigmatarchaeota archaeon]
MPKNRRSRDIISSRTGKAIYHVDIIPLSDNEFQETDSFGTTRTYDDRGALHSFGDEPSMSYRNDKGNIVTMEWHKHGLLHRANKPAVILFSDICEENIVNSKPIKFVFYDEGELHGENNLPAIIDFKKGVTQFWKHGKYIREEITATATQASPAKPS